MTECSCEQLKGEGLQIIYRYIFYVLGAVVDGADGSGPFADKNMIGYT